MTIIRPYSGGPQPVKEKVVNWANSLFSIPHSTGLWFAIYKHTLRMPGPRVGQFRSRHGNSSSPRREGQKENKEIILPILNTPTPTSWSPQSSIKVPNVLYLINQFCLLLFDCCLSSVSVEYPSKSDLHKNVGGLSNEPWNHNADIWLLVT